MFKTMDECRVELEAHTTFPSGGVEDGGWDESDWLPVSAARASFGKEDKTGENEEADRKLLKFLADHRHVSCFEHNYATFAVECPIFVARQIMRHSSFKFNEISRRYTSEKIEFWIPDKWRKQSKSNKQASTDDEIGRYLFLWTGDGRTRWAQYTPQEFWEVCAKESLEQYNLLLGSGLCREQARAVLPQSLITSYYMTGNLRSWWSFLTSRLKDDTQYETRVIAEKIKSQLFNLWPESMGALFSEDTPNEREDR